MYILIKFDKFSFSMCLMSDFISTCRFTNNFISKVFYWLDKIILFGREFADFAVVFEGLHVFIDVHAVVDGSFNLRNFLKAIVYVLY